MKFKRVKGTFDILPEEYRLYKYVEYSLSSLAELYGYSGVETPAFESLELLKAKNPSIVDQIYWFKDKGGREIGLRFDLTVPIARVIAENPQLPKPVRFYYFSKMWRYEEPQKLRYREFWQFGVELIGSSSIQADAEVISLAIDCLRQFGLKFKVFVNDRILLESILERLSIHKRLELFRIIDKREKLSSQAFLSQLRAIGLSAQQIERLMKIIEIRGDIERISMELEDLKSKKVEERLNVLKELVKLIEAYGSKNYLEFDLSVVRGLDYYTGIVFEIFSVEDNKRVGNAICGGGRYDNLIEIYAKQRIPATGFAIGVERLIELLKQTKSIPKEKKIKVLIISDPETSILMRRKLMGVGIIALIDVMGRNLSKNLEFADKQNIPYVIICKELEKQKGVAKVRDMIRGREVEIELDRLETYFKQLL
ncbi:MAG: histidine--tRNA ligase [Candidatus Nanoarchaeia archaeon]|nr:histidine--tRNA ligase [Candidatus Haiyanarchaeum thermophilum]MCW1302821.1 histidine--tRNA ligase [Candidatus Haiyanarchaeum thermophilum]MCW1303502.1 histidine--tRNA ligase [Candidatus Haiyanarchaeum thermophilum]MCW1306682.1 histidine--tRNA ligase [Candidatus Haiyanarchaeum thermophilum]MCW1307362.1 histidine--tRNA ligase [Candidatus Haiyanarchaeum thermophilum]